MLGPTIGLEKLTLIFIPSYNWRRAQEVNRTSDEPVQSLNQHAITPVNSHAQPNLLRPLGSNPIIYTEKVFRELPRKMKASRPDLRVEYGGSAERRGKGVLAIVDIIRV